VKTEDGIEHIFYGAKALDFRDVPPGTTRIVGYYSEAAGRKMAHYFRPRS